MPNSVARDDYGITRDADKLPSLRNVQSASHPRVGSHA